MIPDQTRTDVLQRLRQLLHVHWHVPTRELCVSAACRYHFLRVTGRKEACHDA